MCGTAPRFANDVLALLAPEHRRRWSSLLSPALLLGQLLPASVNLLLYVREKNCFLGSLFSEEPFFSNGNWHR